MKSKAWTEKVMQGVFFIAACTSVLAVALICIFLFANGVPAMKEIGFVKIYHRRNVETEQQDFRDPADDRRKYLCDGGSDSDRCADRNTDVCFYGDVLSETDL